MNVTLLHYNPLAKEMLIATKQTRLAMTPKLLEDIIAWPEEKKQAELDYMRGTIQSSWEFADYIFLIDGVTRAFTHQLVRTRAGSYAQQSQRTVDMEGFDYVATGPLLAPNGPEQRHVQEDPPQAMTPNGIYDNVMTAINDGYAILRQLDVAPQDARGLLPTNITTNIVAKFSLRTLADMAKVRLCTRTQGEYQDVFRLMRQRVIEVHPWAEPFIRVACAATGVCCFPHNTECPIKGMTFNPDTGRRWDQANDGAVEMRDGGDIIWIESRPATRDEIQQAWESTRFEARPKEAK